MATGPQHYQSAEEVLASAKRFNDGDAHQAIYLQLAQVHALLAVAAATAMAGRSIAGDEKLPRGAEDMHCGMHYLDFAAWNKVAGVPAPWETPR